MQSLFHRLNRISTANLQELLQLPEIISLLTPQRKEENLISAVRTVIERMTSDNRKLMISSRVNASMIREALHEELERQELIRDEQKTKSFAEQRLKQARETFERAKRRRRHHHHRHHRHHRHGHRRNRNGVRRQVNREVQKIFFQEIKKGVAAIHKQTSAKLEKAKQKLLEERKQRLEKLKQHQQIVDALTKKTQLRFHLEQLQKDEESRRALAKEKRLRKIAEQNQMIERLKREMRRLRRVQDYFATQQHFKNSAASHRQSK